MGLTKKSSVSFSLIQIQIKIILLLQPILTQTMTLLCISVFNKILNTVANCIMYLKC